MGEINLFNPWDAQWLVVPPYYRTTERKVNILGLTFGVPLRGRSLTYAKLESLALLYPMPQENCMYDAPKLTTLLRLFFSWQTDRLLNPVDMRKCKHLVCSKTEVVCSDESSWPRRCCYQHRLLRGGRSFKQLRCSLGLDGGLCSLYRRQWTRTTQTRIRSGTEL